MELIEYLDQVCQDWRDGDIKTNDETLAEDLLLWFLKRQPAYLDDIVPPCIPSGQELQWVASLFDDDAEGDAVLQARWTAFGYCTTGIVRALLDAESSELSYG
jgi:hypothetical protein